MLYLEIIVLQRRFWTRKSGLTCKVALNVIDYSNQVSKTKSSLGMRQLTSLDYHSLSPFLPS